jgi:hypothetical protein
MSAGDDSVLERHTHSVRHASRVWRKLTFYPFSTKLLSVIIILHVVLNFISLSNGRHCINLQDAKIHLFIGYNNSFPTSQ